MDVRERFLEEECKSVSTKKAINNLYRKIDAFKTAVKTPERYWDKRLVLEFLLHANNKSQSTILTRFSLLKKYLNYIGNNICENIPTSDLKALGGAKPLTYIPKDKLIEKLNKTFVNELDKALFLLMRSGIRGTAFKELTHIKLTDIVGNKVKLANRTVELDRYTTSVVHKAMREDEYKMNMSNAGRIQYDSYTYNPKSEWFWRNRPNSEHNGLTAIKSNSAKEKIARKMNELDIEGLSSASLVNSYIVDKVLETESKLGISLTELQIGSMIQSLGLTGYMYSIYNLKEEIKRFR